MRTGSARPGSRAAQPACRGFEQNAAWLEAVLAAVDLVCWTKAVCSLTNPYSPAVRSWRSATGCSTSAARLTRSARQTPLRIDATWQWASAIATGWQRLRRACP